MYKYLLFDLDGTLTDPGLGITNSVMYALRKFGIDVTDRTTLYKFIGPPLKESFETFFGFSEEKSAQAVKYYREYFSVTGLYENEVYNGIPEVLTELMA
ncbi:MAG: HAD hydrolase-like protein, partial [Ruminiclostridium sp.]|nr:HAD hydrolase-like protein [Ruminiclostridium sp.]